MMDDTMEIWKDVINYKGIYQVSNFGNIKTLHKKNYNNILKPQKRGNYLKVSLCKNGIQVEKSIHVLVAESFLNHKSNNLYIVVNHIDFNKYNNKLNNLEIITSRQNSNKKHIKSTSKYTGVSWSKKAKKWISTIYVNGSFLYLGRFDDEYEASMYYKNALISIKNNSRIKIKRSKHSSKYKGVSYIKKNNKWLSQITINGKSKKIGIFDKEIYAYEAYNNKLKELCALSQLTEKNG